MTAIGEELRQLPVFNLLSSRALHLAASLLTPVTFEPGETICRQGDIGREAFVITSGVATVTREGEPIAELHRGDVVGEAALLGDGYRTATVIATTALKALVMNPREFASLLAMRGVREEIDRVTTRRAAA